MTEQREFFRKKVTSPGYLALPSGDVEFQVRDLSLDGFQACFDTPPDLEEGALVHIRLPALDLERSATVVRIAQGEPGDGTQVGFLFLEPTGRNPAPRPAPPETGQDDDELRF